MAFIVDGRVVVVFPDGDDMMMMVLGVEVKIGVRVAW